MLFNRRRTAMALASFAFALAHSSTWAQPWPSRPVRIIVSQSPGAAVDVMARRLAERLSRDLGQAVIVENKPGGGNIIGAQAAARAAPDGYTFFFATAAALVTNSLTFKTLPYDPAKEFTPVAMIGKGPFAVVAHPSVQALSLAELVALDKANPGHLAFASDGTRGFHGMTGEWLNKTAGMKLRQVPYTSAAQSLNDTVANITPLSVQPLGAAAPFLKSGALRALAVTSASRVPGYDSIPTVAETYPGFEVFGWFALVAPARTPPEIVQRMNAQMKAALEDPQVAGGMRDFGIFTDGAGTVETTEKFLQSERVLWTRMTRSIGIEPE
jgi:tripartite-type tricarboxylate transporter receptor subunit TctC